MDSIYDAASEQTVVSCWLGTSHDEEDCLGETPVVGGVDGHTGGAAGRTVIVQSSRTRVQYAKSALACALQDPTERRRPARRGLGDTDVLP